MKKNILSFDCHESLLTLFSKIPDTEWYLLPYQDWSKWRLHYRNVPDNIHFIMSPKGNYDLAIIFNRHTQFLRIKDLYKLDIPIILQFATSRCNEPDLSRLENTQLVFCGYKQKKEYGAEESNIPVIYYGIDTNEFNNYNGNTKKILTVVNDYRLREKVTRYSLYQEITKGFEADNYGRQDDGLPSPITMDYEHLKQIYRDYAIFLDTANHSPLSMSMLEAMATGMPVITTYHDDMSLIIQDDDNGIISNDIGYLREKMKELLVNPKECKRLGDNARETIKQKFNIPQFIEKWERLIKKVIK